MRSSCRYLFSSDLSPAASQAAARSEETATKLATLESRPAAPAEGFRVGGTTFKLGGFVKAVASATRFDDGMLAGGSLGKEFYLPQQIPVGGAATRDFMANARQTRLFFTSSTPLGGKELKSHIEFDFALATAPAGAQRATNAYTPTLRRAFLTYGRFLVGQEWTTFQNPALLPESTDFVGPLEGTVFVRQMIVQYRQPLGQGLDLLLALENPQTETVTTINPVLSDNDHACPIWSPSWSTRSPTSTCISPGWCASSRCMTAALATIRLAGAYLPAASSPSAPMAATTSG